MGSRCSSLAVVLFSAAALGIQTGAQQNRERTATADERARDRIHALRSEAESLASEERLLLVQLRKLEIERQLKSEELAQIERDRAATQQTLADATSRANVLRRTAEAQRPEVEARLVHIYKLGRGGYWRLLLDVDDLQSLGRAYRTAAALTKIDRERVLAHQRTLEALGRERRELETRAEQIETLENQARRARAALDYAVAVRSGLVASIDARRDLNAQLTSELQAAQQRLQTSVAQLGGGGVSAALPLRPFQGALPWPVRGRITARFGRQPSSRFGTAIVRNGIELEVNDGQLVRAVHEGTVAFADKFTGYGNLVILEHGDRAYSLYGYLDSLQVSKGERVDARSPLGLSGSDPAGNPALYFELRVDGKAVDPLQWLQKGTP